MSIAPGTRLGPYTVIGPLGSGGMGEVYRARDDRLGRDVAVKVLRSEVATDAERLRRFEHEARAAGALNHPQLITVFDTGLHDGEPYLVFELLEGETLRQLLTSGPLAPRRALDLAAGIAEGLAAAHEKGIVHRDLKPENIFVTKEGRPKILDFGLAKLQPDPDRSVASGLATLSRVTTPGTVLGTLRYMSPEQLQGHPVDHRTDIFSLGLILYEMLSGRRPFQRETLEASVAAVLTQDPQPIAFESFESGGTLGIVARCLEKRPEARFQSAHDLAFALRALASPGPTSPRTRQAERAPGSTRWAKPLLVAAGVAAVAAAFWLGRSKVSSPQVAYQRLTFRRGTIHSARFAADGQTVVYAAAWEGEPFRAFMSRIGSPEFTPLALPPADVLALSASGEMALALSPRWLVGQWPLRGTLARAPLAGGAPREVLEDVDWADWAPDGRSLAAVHAVAGRVRLEYPIGKALSISAGWISHPRISPGGDLVAFLDHSASGDDGSVMVVDHSGKKTTLSTGWASVQGLAWHPASREVWFTAARTGLNSRLWAVTLSGRERLIAQAPARLTLHDISAAGRVLLTRDSMQGHVIGLAPGAPRERDYAWFDNSVVTDISPDGTHMLLCESGEGTGSAASVVYLRKMDGSPAVRLGEGGPAFFSPDGKWALSTLPDKLVLLPTGPGEEKRLARHGIAQYYAAHWFPDGARIVFAGSELSRQLRLYIQDVAGGPPRSLTPEGVSLPASLSNPVSPDGAWATGMRADRRLVLYPVEGGSARELPALEAADQPILWADHGRVLYVFQAEGLPARVYRLDIASGRRELWKQILPPDPAGSYGFPSFVLTHDAKSAYAYSYFRQLSELFVAEGLN